jgi:hypothetical protein
MKIILRYRVLFVAFLFAFEAFSYPEQLDTNGSFVKLSGRHSFRATDDALPLDLSFKSQNGEKLRASPPLMPCEVEQGHRVSVTHEQVLILLNNFLIQRYPIGRLIDSLCKDKPQARKIYTRLSLPALVADIRKYPISTQCERASRLDVSRTTIGNGFKRLGIFPTTRKRKLDLPALSVDMATLNVLKLLD